MTKRDQIIETGLSQLYRYGYNRLSFGQLSAETGIAKSSILHHFPSKDALVAAILDAAMDEEDNFLHSLLEDQSTDPRTRLYRYFDHARDQMVKSRYIGSLANGVGLEIGQDTEHPLADKIIAFMERKTETFILLIKEGQESGLFRQDVDATKNAESILIALEGGIVTSRISKSPQLLDIALSVCRNLVNQISADDMVKRGHKERK